MLAPPLATWPGGCPGGRIDAAAARGSVQSLPFAQTLAHVLDHGIHQPGRVRVALTALGRATPELDLVYLLQAGARDAAS